MDPGHRVITRPDCIKTLLSDRGETCVFLLSDAPKDNGGSEIVKYLLELDHGRGEKVVRVISVNSLGGFKA